MSRHIASPVAGIRDVFVGLAVENTRAEASSAIGYALSLAEAAGAHLTLQSASWRISGGDTWLGAFSEDGVGFIDRRLDTLARSIAGRSTADAGLAGVVCTTEAPSLTHPEIVNRLAEQACLHDLTVLDLGSRTHDLDRETIERALFHSGRPVIAVPPGHDAFAARRIIVAWDGGAQAARAANDALPFLRAAEAVEIVSVVGGAEIEAAVPGAEFAPHLARHGVNVSVNDVPMRESVAATLRAQSSLFRADLIVMGAYRHSPTREYIFGGVTRSFLRGSPAPVLLAH
ncbi:MAG: universal stress protein [Parafilimonas terrae]|nr:universal stress protein [Parafilimonas terrae]